MEIWGALVGPCGTGKTLAVKTLAHHPLDQPLFPTIGAAWYEPHSLLVDCQFYSVRLWDISGNTKYSPMVPVYTNNCPVLFFFYDLCAPNPFFFDLYRIVTENRLDRHVDMVVGTHLGGPVDEAARSTIVEWAKSKGFPYFQLDTFDESSLLDLLTEAVTQLTSQGTDAPAVADLSRDH